MLHLYYLRKQIETILNNSKLPIDAAYYVLKDVLMEIEDLYRQQIEKEAAMAASKPPEASQPSIEASVAAEENKTNE